MTWIRIDDHFADHPKAIGLSDAAIAAWLRGLCYAGRYETDGNIPTRSVRAVTRKPKAVAELVDAELWHANGDGYVIHDYLLYNPSHEELEEKRKQIAEDASRRGHNRWKNVPPAERTELAKKAAAARWNMREGMH